MSSTNIQIAIKVRPLIEKENSKNLEPLWLVKENNIVQIDNTVNFIGETYSFDHIFDYTKSNEDVYAAVVKPLVMSCLEGINSTIFAYGQTSSGKTHTMLGDKGIPGIVTYAVQDIFAHVKEHATKKFLLRCSCLEIYNEKINDLLDTKAKDLKIREDYNQGVYVTLKEEVIREPEELLTLMKKGMKTRKIGCTDMNERSSRSHTIFKLVIQAQNTDSGGSYTESTLNLVDLAGSERVGQMNVGRERQVEGVSINKSLTTLGLVIRQLSQNEQFINYRDSKLTRLLQHSLGGNSRTLIIATITVAASEETKSTLVFAQRAKYVKNRPIINEKVTDKDELKQYEHLCADYKGQIEKLRLEKIERDKTINALEDKISTIKIFARTNVDKCGKPSRIPHRRHTISNMASGGLEENSDSEELANIIISPIKSEICLPLTNADDKENLKLDDYMSSSPYQLNVPKHLRTPESPSTLRLEKHLLEESYVTLRSFTNLEKQFQSNGNELEDLRRLTERLRNENSELQEKILKQSEAYTQTIEDTRDIHEKLILLKTVLDVRPCEEMRRKSLCTIVEEDTEVLEVCDLSTHNNEISNNYIGETYQNTAELNTKCASLIEENQRLKRKINENELVIDELKNDINTEKLSKAAISTQLEVDIKHLKSQIDLKDTTISKLKETIMEDKQVKEAELEILNGTINKLNDYKEELHKKLSDKRASEMFSEDMSTLRLINTKLQQDLDTLRRKHEEDTFKIGKLEEDVNALKSLSSEKEKIISEKEFEIDTMTKNIHDLINTLDEQRACKEENVNLKTLISNLESAKDEENARLKETCECLQGELREAKEQLECRILQLAQKSELYNTLLTSNSEKNIVIESLEKEILELNGRLNVFSTWPAVDDLQHLLAERLEEIENLKENQNELIKRLDNTCHNEAEIVKSNATLDCLKTEIYELRNQLHSKIKELNEKSDCYNDIFSKFNCKTIEYECLSNENVELRKELDSLSENMQSNEKEKYVLDAQLELSRLRKENEYLTSLKEENERVKSELEDALFQLHGEQKELESCCRQVDEKSQNIAALERIISNLKNDRENQVKKLQELSNTNARLQEDLKKGENTLHAYKTDMQALQSTCEDQKNEVAKLMGELYSKQIELDEKTESYNTARAESEERLKQIKRLEDEKDELMQRLNTNESNLMDQLHSKQIELGEMTEAYNTARAEREQRLKQIKRLEDEKDEWMQRLNTNESNLMDQLHSKQIELGEMTEAYNTARAESEQRLKQIKRLEDEKDELMQRLNTNESKLMDQLHSKQIELDEKTESYNTARAESEERLKQLKRLEDEKDELMQRLNTNESKLMDQLHSKQIELDEKTESYNTARAEREQRLKQIKRLEDEKDELMQRLNTNESKLMDQLHSKQIELFEMSESYNTVRSESEQRLKQIKRLEDEKDELMQRLNTNESKLMDQLHSKQIELFEMAESYNTVRSESEQRLKQIKRLEDEKDELMQRLNTNESKLLDQLHSKQIELGEMTESYNTARAESEERLKQIKHLEDEKDELMQRLNTNESTLMDQLHSKQIELGEMTEAYNTARAESEQRLKQIKRLEDEKDELMQRLNNSDSKLMDELHSKQIELCEKTESYNTVRAESEQRLKQIKRFEVEKDELVQRLNTNESKLMDQLHSKQIELGEMTEAYNTPRAESEQRLKQIKRFEDEKDEFMQRLNTSDSKLMDELHSKQIELCEKIRAESEQRLKQIKQLEDEKEELMQLESTLLDTKRQLKERCEDYSHLKSKCNALEIQLIHCKKDLTKKSQEFEKERKKISKINVMLQNAEVECNNLTLEKEENELVSTIKRVNRKLLKARSEVQSNNLQLISLQENFSKIKCEHEQCKMELEKVQQRNEEFVKRCNILESQFHAEKNEVFSLRQELQQYRESEVVSLQMRGSKIVQENQSDKNPVSRLSDELGSLSPTDLRRNKRHSIHDQRRGLITDSGKLEDDNLGCSDCNEMRTQLSKVQEEMDELRRENTFLDKENDDMLGIIKYMETNEKKLYEQLDRFQSADMKHEQDSNKENRINQLESSGLQPKYEGLQSGLRNSTRKEHKGTQATCDLHEKYNKLKNIALLRRREANYLRSKLNLPPDCPVLPEDVQRQQKPDSLLDLAS